MRTIKFRVWDNWNKCMNTESEDTIEFEFYDNGYEFVNSISIGHEGDKYTLMQFTGLLDKNGKEIYEGDIVQWEDNTSMEMFGGATLYPEETVRFEGGAFNPVCMMDSKEWEVIGNIYEK